MSNVSNMKRSTALLLLLVILLALVTGWLLYTHQKDAAENARLTEIVDAQTTLDSVKAAQAETEAQLAAGRTAVTEAESALTTARAAVTEAETALTEKQAAVVVAETALAEAASSLEKTRTALSTAESALGVKQEELAKTEADLTEGQTAVADAAAILAEKLTAVAEVEAALTEKQTALAEAESSLSEKQAALAGVENDLDEKIAALTATETSLAEKTAALTDIETTLAEKNAALANIELTLAEKETVLAGIETTLADKQAELVTAEAGQTVADTAAAQQTADDLQQSQIDALTAENVDLNRQLNEANELIGTQEVQLSAQQQQITSLTGELTQAQEETEKTSAKLTSTQLALLSRIGNVVRFGHYEQDNDTANGAEVIEWIVLAQEEDKVLLLAKNGLDTLPYTTQTGNTSWEQSVIRIWLNSDFVTTAFTAEEAADLVPAGITGVEDDTVFLLSRREASLLLNNRSLRVIKPTRYAKAQGTDTRPANGRCWWWLRDIGTMRNQAQVMTTNGTINGTGIRATMRFGAIRPAVWVRLDADFE